MDKVVLPVRGDDSSTNLATSSRPTGTVKVPTRYNDFVQAQEGTSMTQSTFPPILLFPNSISVTTDYSNSVIDVVSIVLL